jgi:hypothetical protein
MDAGTDLVPEHDTTRAGREGRGNVGLINDDRDCGHR